MHKSLKGSKLFTHIECVSSGEDCLKRLSSDVYDLAIIDYKMPKMNGLELLTRIVQNGWEVPVVIVTGRGDERVAVEVMKKGAYDYIIKSSDFLNNLPLYQS